MITLIVPPAYHFSSCYLVFRVMVVCPIFFLSICSALSFRSSLCAVPQREFPSTFSVNLPAVYHCYLMPTILLVRVGGIFIIVLIKLLFQAHTVPPKTHFLGLRVSQCSYSTPSGIPVLPQDVERFFPFLFDQFQLIFHCSSPRYREFSFLFFSPSFS